MEEKETSEKSQVPAVEVAIKILEYLSRFKHRTSTLSEISKDLAINKSTCLRILRVLESHRFVSYDQLSKQYGLGSYLVVLGFRASEFINYLELAKPCLHDLCEQTGHTCVLLEPTPNQGLMYIAKEEPHVQFRVTVSVGQQFPLTSASFGKCYLAFTPEEKVDDIIKKVGFRQFTNKTILNIEQFKEVLKEVRHKGFAESIEEHTLGIFGIAAPIYDLNGEINMVVACIGMATQLNTTISSVLGGKVKETAANITHILGGKAPAFAI